jgi:pimeloyl-ACP methyl ester carboxylesterase
MTFKVIPSASGATIGYRQYGGGPGVVLVQGAMGSAYSFHQLAESLADSFTVYVPDRRGRGMSPFPYTPDHSLQRDVEDLDAVLSATNSHAVFGLSSGAIISLTAARSLSSIQKLAVFEPPLFTKDLFPEKELKRYREAMACGNVAAALAAAGKSVRLMPPLLNLAPNWLLAFLTKQVLAAEEANPPSDYLSLRELAGSLQFDFRVVTEMHTQWNTLGSIQSEVLLLGGSDSPQFLKRDLDTLENTLPRSFRVELQHLGHAAAWNRDPKRNPKGRPEAVAAELQRFFRR